MKIIIQTVTVSWNKNYRGGENANIRNSTPEAFELPLEAFLNTERKIPVHQVRYSHYNNYIEPTTNNVYLIDSSKIKLKGTYIKMHDDYSEVFFCYSSHDCGKPYRSRHDETGTLIPLEEKAFDLFNNEYGRIVFNGRYTDFDTGNWWYEKKVHNIILLEKYNKDVFVKNVISKEYSQLASLK